MAWIATNYLYLKVHIYDWRLIRNNNCTPEMDTVITQAYIENSPFARNKAQQP